MMHRQMKIKFLFYYTAGRDNPEVTHIRQQ